MLLYPTTSAAATNGAQAHLERQRVELAALAKRLDAQLSSELGAASLHNWRGPASGAFVEAAIALRKEVLHLIEAVRTAHRLTETAEMELEHSV